MEGGAVAALAARARPTAPQPTAAQRGRRARADEGRDAQPPDRDLARSRVPPPAPAARSATKARPAAAPAQGRADRLRGLATCTCPVPTSRGSASRVGKPGAHRQPAADHDRGPARRRRVQQRVRPAQPAAATSASSSRPSTGVRRGYHKPIMIAGGLGTHRRRARPRRSTFPAGTLLIQLGGPGMRIGMGGGAASLDGGRRPTRATSTSTRCSAATPRSSAARRRSSTTAGRWATATRSWRSTTSAPAACRNAFPELVDGAGRGARFDLREVPLEESGLAPKEIWCNESQERYVLAHRPRVAGRCSQPICARERCPFAVVGVATTTALELAEVLEDVERRGPARSTCRWRCCSASRRG